MSRHGIAAIIALIAISFSPTSGLGEQIKEVTVKGDKLYGACYASALLDDFFKRFPPDLTDGSASFTMEINYLEAANEVEVYYHAYPSDKSEKPKAKGSIAYYDGDSCEFLRAEDPDAENGTANE